MEATIKKSSALDQGLQSEVFKQALALIDQGFKVCPFEEKQPFHNVKSLNRLRQKPIHNGNAEFYFKSSPQIAFLTGEKLEVIDVDAKNDLTGSLNGVLLYTIEMCLSEVFKKLVIEHTPSGGLHIYYKCNQIGGKTVLGQRPGTPEEIANGERVKVLIEALGEANTCVCYPSPGYALTQNSFEDIDYITPEERAEIFAICRSFDKITKPAVEGLSKSQSKQECPPWDEFNKDHGWEWMIDLLCDSGFELISEDESRLVIKRAGSEKKSSGSIWKESSVMYLFSTSTEFKANTPYSAFGILCALSYDNNVQACAKDLADQGIGQWNWEDNEFYSIGKKGKVEIKLPAIVDWCHDIGLRKLRTSESDFTIVQVVSQKVKITDLDRIKKIFGDYISKTVTEKIYNVFLGHIKSIFSKEGIISQLNDLDETKFVKGTSKVGWFYFQNVALKIRGDEIELVPYENIEGLVWEKNILKRDFKFADENGDHAEFFSLISNGEEARLLCLRSAVGYLLHDYKDPINPKVIILNDEYYDEEGDSEPQGGTGKGLIIKFISNFCNTLSLDGKRWDPKKNFALQRLSHDTRILAFEDVSKQFNFETLFSAITEGYVVEKKNQHEFFIPYEKSPKTMITTNYAIKGRSSSHARRRYELEVSFFFSHKYRPIDHFKKRFFDDWDDNEWLAFDNYMVNSLQMFIKDGLPDQQTINLEKKRVIQETNRDFFNWIEEMYLGEGLPELKIPKSDFKEKFTNLFPDYAHGKSAITDALFTRWLTTWCEYKDVKLDSRNHFNGIMVYYFTGQLTAFDVEKSYALSKMEIANKCLYRSQPPFDKFKPIDDAPFF